MTASTSSGAPAPNVYIANTFAESANRLGETPRNKAWDFLRKFKENPRAPAIHLETIVDTRDEQLRSARIDVAYRCVLFQTRTGNDFVLLWVAKHDDAYDWARTKRFDINPAIGSWQIIDLKSVAAMESATKEMRRSSAAEALKGPFSLLSDHDLMSLGVPRPFFETIRALPDDASLTECEAWLPKSQYEALFLVAAGDSVQAARAKAGIQLAETPVDVTDVGRALENPNTQVHIRLVDSEELGGELDKPIQMWRYFLHPSQRAVVERDFSGPARLLGGAGTGKTVVAMHRARRLAREICTEPGERVLFTTYTRLLAADIRQTMAHFCSPIEMARIDVLHLHEWARDFVNERRAESGAPTILIAGESELRSCWAQVYQSQDNEFPVTFYQRELAQIIRPQEIRSRNDYFQAPRTGQGIPLTRAQRDRVWHVIERYRQLLAERRLMEWGDVIETAREEVEKQAVRPYRAIIIDEAQDWSSLELRLLRAMAAPAANDLFFTGDGHQRIYGRPVTFLHCGIDVRGRSSKLRLNYRTTEPIRRWSVALLRNQPVDDLDGGQDDHEGYSSVLQGGVRPAIRHFSSRVEEIDYVAGEIQTLAEMNVELENICIAARTRNYLDDWATPLRRQKQLAVCMLGDDRQDDESSGVRLSTMHRIKGLEFQYVFLVGVNAGLMPLGTAIEQSDPAEAAAELARERCLLHVAATRARDGLTVTASGPPSPFLTSH
jgi:superfamily I DNA/RNA helicase